jgi:hypothetical protein
VAAIAKLVSAAGSARALLDVDPILGISFQNIFCIVGTIELFIGLICLLGNDKLCQVSLLACLSTMFLIYRVGLVLIGYQGPCACMGNLTDALHIPAKTADTAMKIILAYLLIGSYATLFWLWRQKRNASLVASSPAKATSFAS